MVRSFQNLIIKFRFFLIRIKKWEEIIGITALRLASLRSHGSGAEKNPIIHYS